MRLGVEHILVQADQIRWRENEIEVLESLGQPETLQRCQ